VLIAVAGGMNQRQLRIMDYLREENRALREQLGGRRLPPLSRPRPWGPGIENGPPRNTTAVASADRDPHRTAGAIEVLVVRMAEENREEAVGASAARGPIWGTRLPAAMIAEILERHGIEPAPSTESSMASAT
jgi:hypothetical protein